MNPYYQDTKHLQKRDTLVLVCGADDKFAMPLAITLFSALTNLENYTSDLFVIDAGISYSNKKRIEKILKNTNKAFHLQWIPYNLDSIQSVQESSIISKAAYLRILIADLLPNYYQKAIYLDCDMIVEGDLSEIWDIGFADEPAMGVQDFYYPFVSTHNAIPDFDKYKILPTAPYCNSGMLVINLNYWRREKLSSQIFKYLNDNTDSLRHFDQDGINAIIAGRWKLLDPRWNVSLSSVAVFGQHLSLKDTEINWYKEQFRKHPFIIHYTSRHKPWHVGHSNNEALTVFYYDSYYRGRFFYYLEQSGWFSYIKYKMWSQYRRVVLTVEFKIPRKLKSSFNIPLRK